MIHRCNCASRDLPSVAARRPLRPTPSSTALVQDAALRFLAQEPRPGIARHDARVIETRFWNIEITEPEVPAHHLTAAGLAAAAIPLWRTAGELALKRIHLNRGLDLVPTLSCSSGRDASQLGLGIRLGPAWTALKGPAYINQPGSTPWICWRQSPCLPNCGSQRTDAVYSKGQFPTELRI
jgi:hypothetical protein